jgi:hypothetical protein
VITQPDGSFRLGLDPGPTRDVLVSFDGSQRYRATESEQLRLRVGGRAELVASSDRVTVGTRFSFRGRIFHMGARLPRGGKLVELQVARPEGWDTVRQAFRTDSRGRWRFPFRFGNYYSEPTRFRFRLKVMREEGWPYQPVATAPRAVTVIPRR